MGRLAEEDTVEGEVSTGLVVRESSSVQAVEGGTSPGPSLCMGPPTQHELAVYNTMAVNAESSEMYKHLGDKNAIMMVMLIARELGVPPMTAINRGIVPIQGNLEISARLLTALIRRAGHRLNIVESTDQICVIEGVRKDTGEKLKTSYSVEDAKKAGLVRSGGGWVRNPRDMCFARAASRLARQLFSDVIGMGYVEGEIRERVSPVEKITEPEKEEGEVVSEFLKKLDKDQDMWMKYIQIVSEKYGWSKRSTIEKFEENIEETQKKFESWKAKSTSS